MQAILLLQQNLYECILIAIVVITSDMPRAALQGTILYIGTGTQEIFPDLRYTSHCSGNMKKQCKQV